VLSKEYLKRIHDTGTATEDVMLRASRLYDFIEPEQRREWLEIVVALMGYLKSGESRVGYLNNSLQSNMLHKEFDERSGEYQARDQMAKEDEAMEDEKQKPKPVRSLRETSALRRTRSFLKRKAEPTEPSSSKKTRR